MTRIPNEPMSYKSLLKENELLTKLRIIRMTYSPRLTHSRIAKIFGCHRNTVRNLCLKFNCLPKDAQTSLLSDTNLTMEEITSLMAPLTHNSTRPHRHPREPDDLVKYSIIWLFEECGWRVGYRSMHEKIQRSFGDYQTIDLHLFSLTKLSARQIRTIYQNAGLKSHKVRTRNGDRKPLYDYTALGAFERMHFDTKVLADAKSLPNDVYLNLLNNREIPKYQWTLIDAKTKVRFVAYSYNLNAEFGLKFLLFALSYIRFTWGLWEMKIIIGFDNGVEFCSSSVNKLADWNQIFAPLNACCYAYHPYFDVRKNIVERSHRIDDDYFLVARGNLLTNKEVFKAEVRSFFEYYNFERAHSGMGMNSRTPYEKLMSTNVIHPERLLRFPIMILEEQISVIGKTVDTFLFQAELRQQQQKLNTSLSQKQIIDASVKYQFFDDSAQKVLTHYLP